MLCAATGGRISISPIPRLWVGTLTAWVWGLIIITPIGIQSTSQVENSAHAADTS